jgi:hypothetical protein
MPGPMPLKKSIPLAALAVLTFASCRTLKDKDFAVDEPLYAMLPPLEATLNIDSLYNQMAYGRYRGTGHYKVSVGVKKPPADSGVVIVGDSPFTSLPHRFHSDSSYKTARFEADRRVLALIRLFAQEVYGSEKAVDTTDFGTVEMRLISFSQENALILNLVGAFSLGMLSLVAIPFDYLETRLEIGLTIYDRRGERIAQFTGGGYGRASVAYFWGYGKDAAAKAAVEAMKSAMLKIRGQVRLNKSQISLRLLE